jgi:hypothetical protein
MSLHSQPSVPSIPQETAQVARAAFPRGNPYMTLRDDLGPVFVDRDFDDLDRIAAWLQGRPLAPTRRSRFAALVT